MNELTRCIFCCISAWNWTDVSWFSQRAWSRVACVDWLTAWTSPLPHRRLVSEQRLCLRRIVNYKLEFVKRIHVSRSESFQLPGITKRSTGYVHACAIIDSLHRCVSEAWDTKRSATSFWNVNVIFVLPNAQGPRRSAIACNHLIISGVDTLNGKLPMMWISGGLSFHIFFSSTGNRFSIFVFIISSYIMSIFPFIAWKESANMSKLGLNLWSFSITTIRLGTCFRIDRVNPPGPGPTSNTWVPASFPAFLMILSHKFWSMRKFCDRRLTAFSWYSLSISRTVGSGGNLGEAILAKILCDIVNGQAYEMSDYDV